MYLPKLIIRNHNMSKKSVKATSKKRAQRKLSSKCKKKIANRSPSTKHFCNKEFEALLTRALKEAGINGDKNLSNDIQSRDDVVKGIKSAVSEAFKLYCYTALGKEMIDRKIIDHSLNINMEEISTQFIELDNRITQLEKLDDELAFSVEALEIGSLIQKYSEELYGEITRLEPFAIPIEETIDELAKTDDTGSEDARRGVLERVGYHLLMEVNQKPSPIIEEVDEEEFSQTGFKTTQAPIQTLAV